MATTIERIKSKVSIAENGCWEWTGAVSSDGYAHIGMRRHPGKWDTKQAHRVAYEAFRGPIPEGLVIDHLCRNRRCVNPDHLEPVTPHENTLRGFSGSGINARKTQCVNGHPFDDANTYRWNGLRFCRACNRAAAQKAKLRRMKGSGQ